MLPPEPVRPPRSEAELLARALALRGRTVGELAALRSVEVPSEPRRAKGFTGQLLEALLGATAASRSTPDFERIGVEMKSLPIGRNGVPTESTYVCTVDLLVDPELAWASSRARKKLVRVLWVPVQGDPTVALALRRIGTSVLWSPDEGEMTQLATDFAELMDLIRMGQGQAITAHQGVALQIRPKGDNSRAVAWGIDENGHRAKVASRGFYLRPTFTAAAIARALNPPRP